MYLCVCELAHFDIQQSISRISAVARLNADRVNQINSLTIHNNKFFYLLYEVEREKKTNSHTYF